MKESRSTVVRHLLAAGRIYFLGGGVLVYMMGAVVAWYEGVQVAVRPLLLGLMVVLLLQLMTNYLNEYWDRDSDALVTIRTPFSGGSGVLASGLLSARTVYLVAIACGVTAVLLTVVIGFADHLSLLALLAVTLTLLGGMAYSQPPLRLAARGVGEITAGVVVCSLVPLIAYSLQTTGGISRLFIVTCLPAAAMQFAMVLAISLPDYAADWATHKETLVVRLGQVNAARLYAAALVVAYILSAAGLLLGLPRLAAVLPLAELPIAVVQIGLARDVAAGDKTKIPLLAFLAVALFVVFVALQIVGYGMQGRG